MMESSNLSGPTIFLKASGPATLPIVMARSFLRNGLIETLFASCRGVLPAKRKVWLRQTVR